jgi:hypothetical protein
MIVMADPDVARRLGSFVPNLVVIDPLSPDQAERRIVEQLKEMNTGLEARKALLALGTLALGLLIFAPRE